MAENLVALPETVNRYRVTRAILTESAELLRRTGAGVREAVILWQGCAISATTAAVSRVVVPRQITGPLHFNVPLSERLRIAEAASQAGELVVVQLHTHPQEAFHSEADDRYAIIKHTGALSIVVPDFGVAWKGDLRDSAVFVHMGAARWRQAAPDEVARTFEIVP